MSARYAYQIAAVAALSGLLFGFDTAVINGALIFLRGGWFSLVGASAARGASELFLDRIFVGVNAIDTERGLTCLHPDEAAINRALVAQARQRIVVADHSKLGQVVACLICPTREVHMLITDTGASDEDVRPFEELGIEVRRA